MKIKSEWELLDRIRGRLASAMGSHADIISGIGDDCAVFTIDGTRCGLITTDISIEKVHFRLDFSSPEDIGFKAMSGNLSDIAAMGGRSRFAFVSLGIPHYIEEDFIMSLYDGMIASCEGTGTAIEGGDISAAGELVVNITLYGEVPPEGLVRRSGAAPGDTIYITGTIGGSAAGLSILQSGKDLQKWFPGLIKKHLRPDNRIAQSEHIVRLFKPSAMIDVSDGLLSDLRHICESSNCGFVLDREHIPLHEGLADYAQMSRLDPYQLALESGEEYELLFTSPEKLSPSAREELRPLLISEIGKITDKGYILRSAGKNQKIPIQGFDHFKK